LDRAFLELTPIGSLAKLGDGMSRLVDSMPSAQKGEEHAVAAVTSHPAHGVDATRTPGAWAWTLLLFGGGIWGITFSLAKLATAGGAHPFGITLWQGVLGGLLLLAFNIARRQALPLRRRFLIFYLVCGLLGTAIPSTLFFYAAEHIPAGVLSICIAAMPILTFAAALTFRLDVFAFARCIGIGMGLLSVLLLVGPESSLPDPSGAPWVAVALLAAGCYAAENIYIAMRLPPGGDAGTILCGMLLMAGFVMVPIVLATNTFTPLILPLGIVELSVVGMALVNVVSYGLFVYLVSSAGPVFASQMAYVVTLSGVVWGIALFNEQHTIWVWSALVTMLVGLVLVKPRKKDHT
jgi:drug/metabolite transporter (DMT)-like permease